MVTQQARGCQTSAIRAPLTIAVGAATAAAALALLTLSGPAPGTAAPREGTAGSRPGFGPAPNVSCPGGEVIPAAAADTEPALATARRFARAWFENDADGAVALAEPVFRDAAARLAAGRPASPRAFTVGVGGGLGHSRVGIAIARRCGPAVLTGMRIIDVELRGSDLGATLLLVLRHDGWRVAAVL